MKGILDMKKMKNEEGFTILEVLVSMIILTLSLLILLNMAMLALENNDWSNKATSSTQLIQDKLEELRTDKVLASGADSLNGISRTWTVTKVASHLRKVDMLATWENQQGKTLQNSMSAYIRTTKK